jgi:hypothetical protein
MCKKIFGPNPVVHGTYTSYEALQQKAAPSYSYVQRK